MNMFLISSITTEATKLVTDQIKSGWDKSWDIAFTGDTFKILTQLGVFFAVSTLLIWIIVLFKDFADDKGYYKFGEFIWPIVVILLLINGGSNLATLTTGLRSVINQTNDKVLSQLLAGADLNQTLDALSNYTNFSVALRTQASQCYTLQSNEQEACINRVVASANDVKAAYDSSFLDQAGALSRKLAKQISDIPKSVLKDPVKTLTSSPTDTLTNAFASPANSVGLLLADTIMLASLAAFQGLIEISFLLTGLIGPIAVGTSLLPVGAKPLYAWFTSFWSLGIAKLSLNIIVGFVAISVTTSGENTGLSTSVLLGVLSPILALALAGGGGILIFNSIVGAAAAAAALGVSFARAR